MYGFNYSDSGKGICIYVYLSIYLSIHIYICIFTYVYLYVYLSMYIQKYINVCICTCIFMYICICFKLKATNQQENETVETAFRKSTRTPTESYI